VLSFPVDKTLGELEKVKPVGWPQGSVLTVGAKPRAHGRCEFVVWAPNHKSVKLRLVAEHIQRPWAGDLRDNSAGDLPKDSAVEVRSDQGGRTIEMERNEFGYFRAEVVNVPAAARYMYQLGTGEKSEGGTERPDPASRFQPDGVHGASQVIDLSDFAWADGNWKAPLLEQSIFYELHIGTFTQAGTLDTAKEELPKLADLGITTIELMPLAQFPGTRNWGYDGVYPYAVQNSYGGPRALQRFVNAAHGLGLAVALDVVYNHLGPEGNYLGQFGPYFTNKYTTPWGQAINFDGAHSEPVRRFFIENAIHWIENYHIDVLRLDAIHGIFDFGAVHYLAELQMRVSDTAKRLGRDLTLVAESDLNDVRVLLSDERGGYGLRAQWSDDFHHSLHALLTKETRGYYGDFGRVADLGIVLRDGWLYQGQYSAFRKRRHGNSPRGTVRSSFVVCAQNHDQVGNRALGERLSRLVSFEAQKLAAGVLLLSPFVPLLFMGEEHGEMAPFLYFAEHADPDLVEAVRKGRRAEFEEFGWQEEVPDPQDTRTFEKAKLRGAETEHQKTLRRLYQKLMTFRRQNELGANADWQITEDEKRKILRLTRTRNGVTTAILLNFGDELAEERACGMARGAGGSVAEAPWTVEICSSDRAWLGTGVTTVGDAKRPGEVKLAPMSFIVLQQGNVGETP
jgi:maltooligosyltrehalose trehalohydrolase